MRVCKDVRPTSLSMLSPRPIPLLLSALALAASLHAQTAPSPAPPFPAPSSQELQLLNLANADRAQHRLAPLAWDPTLARAARLHAQRTLAEHGELSHQFPGEPTLVARAAFSGTTFAAVAENLAGHAQAPTEIERMWMSTPVHRGNLLDGSLNAVGISILTSGGLLFAVEDFARTVPSLTPDTIEGSVANSLHDRGIASVQTSSEARRICRTGNIPADSLAVVVQWDGPDPTSLPPTLLRELSRQPFHSATVGACPGRQSGDGFTTAHVAVLLF